jgi:NADH-quinone oxidoreductase subunit K
VGIGYNRGPMLPITHVLYVASGLFVLGLVGVTLRRGARALHGLVLALAATGLVWAVFARAWGEADGQVFAALALVIAGAYAVVGTALARAQE